MFLFSARLALPFRGLGIVTRGRLVLGHFVHMHTCLAFLGCVMLTIGELSRQISLFGNLLRRLGYNNSRACISFLSTRRIWDVCLPVRDLPPFGHSMKFLKCVLDVTLHAGECISASLGLLQANLHVFPAICQLPCVLVCLYPSSMMTAATSGRCRNARMHMTSVPAGTPMAPFAAECLTTGTFDRAAVQLLFELLPKTRPHRITGSAEPGTAFFGGTVHQDGVTVPRTSCFEYPDSMRVINAFLHSVDPVHRDAAFVLTKNVTSRVHRDPRNGAANNMVVRISDFAEGGLWIQDPKGTVFREYQGSWVPGQVHSLQSGPVYLDARSFLHATEPWDGDRLIAIAYTPQQMHLLSLDDSAFLQSLGFPVRDSFPAGGEATAESPDVTMEACEDVSKVPSIDSIDMVTAGPPEAFVTRTGHVPPMVNASQGPGPPEAFDSRTGRVLPIDNASEGPPEAFDSRTGRVLPIDNVSEGPPEALDSRTGRVLPIDNASEGPPEAFDPRTSRSFGQPMICRFQMCKQEFVDGFGLCSPGRWAPEAREKLAAGNEIAHAEKVRGLLREFVTCQLKDPKGMAFRLATGHLKESPFSGEALQGLRQKIVSAIPGDRPTCYGCRSVRHSTCTSLQSL